MTDYLRMTADPPSVDSLHSTGRRCVRQNSCICDHNRLCLSCINRFL